MERGNRKRVWLQFYGSKGQGLPRSGTNHSYEKGSQTKKPLTPKSGQLSMFFGYSQVGPSISNIPLDMIHQFADRSLQMDE